MRSRLSLRPRHWLAALLTCTYGTFFSLGVLADDIDIYFGGPDEEQMGRPNVLFVLDDSGSMRWDLDRDSNPSGGRPSRMDVLQDAFNEIMTEVQGINAGLMTLNNQRHLYPVTYIETPLDQGGDSVPSSPVLSEDGRENSRGEVHLREREHTLRAHTSASVRAFEAREYPMQADAQLLGKETGSNSGHYEQVDSDPEKDFELKRNRGNGLIFNEVVLNAGTRINSARLQLFPKEVSGSWGKRVTLKLSLEQSRHPSTFSKTTVSPTLRPAHSWEINGQLNESDGALELDGFEGALQQLLEDLGELQGVALYLHLENADTGFEFYAHKNSATTPKLILDIDGAGEAQDNQLIALRFSDIPVPQGAVIESAYLELDPSSNSDNNLAIEIRAENSGNSAALAESNRNFSSRPAHSALINWSTQGLWTKNEPVQSSDLTPLLNQVTSHPDWCGNNALTLLVRAKPGSAGVRSFYSQQGVGQAPKLHVNFVPGSDGCINNYLYRRTGKSRDDVYQRDNRNNDMNYTSSTLRISSSRRTGLHFPHLPIKPGARVLEARLALTLAESSPSTTLKLGIENSANAPEFSGARNELRNRSNASYPASSWSVPRNSPRNSQIVSPDFSTELQKVIDKSGWNSQQAIALHLSGGSELRAYSYDHSKARAPLLMLKIAHGGLDDAGGYTVRHRLIELVNAMNANGGTPIAPTMLDASKYYLNQSGKSEWPTPIEYECQANHLVLLTDGQANGSSSGTRTAIGNMIGNGSCTQDAANRDEQCVRSLSHWLGDTDLSSSVEGINNLTVHTIGFAMGGSSSDAQNARQFMRDLAQENQGCTDAEMDEWERDPDNAKKNCGFYLPDNAASLVDAFNQIFNSINSTDSSFVSPGAGVNQFNRSQHRNELYFSLFKPMANERWPGNVKRYALNTSSSDPSLVEIQDVIGASAVNPDSGFFKESAQSYWSPAADGNSTDKGGMASRLPDPASRKLFTLIDGKLSPVEIGNAKLTAEMLGASSDEERSTLINWTRGYDDNGNLRNAIGDPLHSRPALVTYRCNQWADAQLRTCAAPSGLTEHSDSALLFGTNEGYLHAINTNADPSVKKGGQEHFAFIPPELLGNIRVWKNNPQISSKRHYGLDGSPTLWVNDLNRNGVIFGGRDTRSSVVTELPKHRPNDGEFVYAYIGMRRGGNNYYGLDITTIDNPSLLWTIQGRQGDFTRLGQSWAKPIKSRVRIGETIRDVLFISGGYDETQDQDDSHTYNQYRGSYKTDSVGNAIYMVDAVTGELLWSASAPGDSGRTHDLTLDRMNYSIPGGIRVVDLYGDGLADQLFFSDMGGQIWRLYINNGEETNNLVWPADSNGSGSVDSDDGVFAYLGYPAEQAGGPDGDWAALRKNARRFYNEPDVSIFRKNGVQNLALSIGSGFHSDPMGKIAPETENMFFMLSSSSLFNPVSAGNDGKKISKQETIDLNNAMHLKDMTQDMSSDPIKQGYRGWYIRLHTRTSEVKAPELVTAPALTQDGVIYFNSYQPGMRASGCNATDGLGRAYAINLFNGAPAFGDGSSTNPDDRYQELKSGGMPPGTIILRPDGENEVICIGAECTSRKLSGQYGRTHWREVE